jgi:hypothetical protein
MSSPKVPCLLETAGNEYLTRRHKIGKICWVAGVTNMALGASSSAQFYYPLEVMEDRKPTWRCSGPEKDFKIRIHSGISTMDDADPYQLGSLDQTE